MKRTMALGLLVFCTASADAQVFYVTPTVVAPNVRYYVPAASSSYYVPATNYYVPATSYYMAAAPSVRYYVPAAAPLAVPAATPAVQMYVPAAAMPPRQIERFYFYGNGSAPQSLPSAPVTANNDGGTIVREYYYLPPESRGTPPASSTPSNSPADPTLKMPDPNRALSEEALRQGLPADGNPPPQPKKDPPASSTESANSST